MPRPPRVPNKRGYKYCHSVILRYILAMTTGLQSSKILYPLKLPTVARGAVGAP
jgi:hypothetical protein